jgi:hypothetical protein
MIFRFDNANPNYSTFHAFLTKNRIPYEVVSELHTHEAVLSDQQVEQLLSELLKAGISNGFEKETVAQHVPAPALPFGSWNIYITDKDLDTMLDYQCRHCDARVDFQIRIRKSLTGDLVDLELSCRVCRSAMTFERRLDHE